MSASPSLLRRAVLATLVAGAALAAGPLAQAANDWPNKPMTLVVPFPPGSSPDLIARAVAEPVAASLGQPIVIENKPGAGGNIGTRQVAQAKPDGYTILFTINGPLVTAPRLYQKTLGYDPVKDLAPVSLIATSPNVLVVNPDIPANTLQEFVDLVKSKPGTYNYGSVGPGSASHLAMEMFKSESGTDLLHVPYSGFPQVITAIMAGDVHSGFMVPAIAMPQVEAGKAKALAISSSEPSPLLADVDTVANQGMPGFEAISWQAILVPAGTPEPIVQRLNQEIDAALKDEKVRQLLDKAYFSPVGGSPDVLAQQIQDETGRWTAVIDSLNLSLD
ncbi:MAG: tripartite tricarboxylate transporter substrate binding protein [Pigmentiphaga sp.]|nr:tripartite tricarboxylate transporter substrate binding protein [Pigmentiphaga sp.]